MIRDEFKNVDNKVIAKKTNKKMQAIGERAYYAKKLSLINESLKPAKVSTIICTVCFILMAALCIAPCFILDDYKMTIGGIVTSVLAGIFIFVLRNKQRVNYDEYISERLRRQQAYRNSQYGNPYGRPPYGGNPYVRPPYGDNPYGNHYGQQSNQSEPFEDFKTQDTDPFEEFSNESKANTNTNSNSDDDLFN